MSDLQKQLSLRLYNVARKAHGERSVRGITNGIFVNPDHFDLMSQAAIDTVCYAMLSDEVVHEAVFAHLNYDDAWTNVDTMRAAITAAIAHLKGE